MSSEWIKTTIGTLVDASEAIVQTGPFGSQLHKHDYVKDGVPIIPTEAIGRGRILDITVPRISEEKADELSRHRLLKDDILFARRGAQATGCSAIVDDRYVGGICGTGALLLRVNGPRVHAPYLSLFLSSNFAFEWLRTHAVGAVMPNLNTAIIKALPFTLPTLVEQKELSTFIGSIDARIVLLRKTNATLEAIAQALFKSWFVDFDPVRTKVERREPQGLNSELADLFPDAFVPTDSYPAGWTVSRLGEWLSVLETGRRPKGGVADIKSGIPSIGAESIVRIGQFDYSKTKYVGAAFFNAMKGGKLESHDVLLYKDGGKPGVFLPRVSMFGRGYPFDVCGINEHVFRLRIKKPFSQAFLYFWLWSDASMHELKHRGGKAAIPGINQADVKELKILVPPESILHRFDEAVSPLLSKILDNAKQAETLASIRDAVLPRLISGALSLPEAGALLRDAA